MKNIIRKILKEEMYINDKGEIIDDDEKTLDIGDEVKVIIYVGNYDFVFPGHYGYVSVTGIDNHGDYEGVVIDEDLSDGDVEHLHMKGYLKWNEDYDIWNFYPYYEKEE